MTNGMNGMLGKVGAGTCRLSVSGNIAVKTSTGYKSYNVNTGKLTNCDNFVFNIGEEFFFVIPTNKVKKGDIILVGGKPKCVIEPGKNEIKVIDYEDSSIKIIVPERHQFMGNTYFYGKIVSMFGNNFNTTKDGKKKSGPEKIMQYMMLSSMFKGKGGSASSTNNAANSTTDITTPFGDMDMSNMMPFMLMSSGGFGNMFDGMFDFDDEEEDDDEETNATEE